MGDTSGSGPGKSAGPRKAQSDSAPPLPNSGSFNLVGNTRSVSASHSFAAPRTRMISYHEGCHAFLNASTSFGGAITFTGALVNAGFSQFQPLLTQLKDACLTTHETYATVAALCSASDGRMSHEFLSEFPTYMAYLSYFEESFGRSARSFVTIIAFTSCARAAMQTPVDTALFARPCHEWPEIRLELKDRPDQRFDQLMTPALAQAAIEAVDLLRMDLEPAEYRNILAKLDIAGQDLLNARSFEVYAAALADLGHARPSYNVDRDGALRLITKIKEFAGEAMEAEFHVPIDMDGDQAAVFLDYRKEEFRIAQQPLRAVFGDAANYVDDKGRSFILSGSGDRYLQFVAMPRDKARFLYHAVGGRDVLNAAPAILAGVRQRWSAPGEGLRVEFLAYTRDRLLKLIEIVAPVDILPIITTSAIADEAWRAEWSSPPVIVKRFLALIDTDPFALLERYAGQSDTNLTFFGARLAPPSDDYMEVFCLSAKGDPDVLYFTPCTTALRQAVFKYAQMEHPHVTYQFEEIRDWMPMLQRAVGHVVNEEGHFGFDFWRR
jgi:hypothetical protein